MSLNRSDIEQILKIIEMQKTMTKEEIIEKMFPPQESLIDFLERASKEQGIPLLCAKRKDGSWLIYIAPNTKDIMTLMLQATLQIEMNK